MTKFLLISAAHFDRDHFSTGGVLQKHMQGLEQLQSNDLEVKAVYRISGTLENQEYNLLQSLGDQYPFVTFNSWPNIGGILGVLEHGHKNKLFPSFDVALVIDCDMILKAEELRSLIFKAAKSNKIYSKELRPGIYEVTGHNRPSAKYAIRGAISLMSRQVINKIGRTNLEFFSRNDLPSQVALPEFVWAFPPLHHRALIVAEYFWCILVSRAKVVCEIIDPDDDKGTLIFFRYSMQQYSTYINEEYKEELDTYLTVNNFEHDCSISHNRCR